MSSTPKTILILNRVFPPSYGATGRMACDLALHLRKAGHKITVVTTAPARKVDKAKNLDVIRAEAKQDPDGVVDYLRVLKAMKKEAKRLPPHDIVISMTDPPLQAMIGHKIAKKMKAKHIHWAMDLYPDLLPVMGKEPPKFIYRIVENKMHKAIKKANAIVPISKCMARYMTYHSLPRHKMYVIENWPDRYLLDYDEEDVQSLFDNDKFRVLYAGTIGLCHEFTTVLRAAKYLQSAAPEIEFVFTATGRGKDILKHQIQKIGLTNIRMIQPQSSRRLTALMATGDLHLITMRPDAVGKLFPSKFYAACAAGRPVLFVGPEECDLHEKIRRNSCGVSVRNGDAQSLVRGILGYLKDSDSWFKAGENMSNILSHHDPLTEWQDLIESQQ